MMIRFLQFILLFPVVLLYSQVEKSYSYYIKDANKLKYNNWKQAELNIKKAEDLVEDKDFGDFYLESAKIYKDVDRFDAALEYAVKAHDIFTEQKNDEQLAKTDALFAYTYSQMNDTKRAISYYKRLLKYYKLKKNNGYILKALNNIGNGYTSLNKLDSAQYYFHESIPLFEHYNNPTTKAMVYSNIGKLNFFKGNVPEAEKYLLDANEILIENNSNDKQSLYTTNFNLANFYISTNQPQKALFYAKELEKYNISKTANFDYVNCLNTLYRAYLLNKDYKNSALVFEKYDSMREQMNLEQKAVNVERLKIQHEYELQKKIKDLEEGRKNTLFTVVLIILFLVVAICILFLINYKNKAEQLRLENKLIEAREKQLDMDNELKEKMLVQKSMEQSKVEEIFKSILDQINKLKAKHDDKYINEVSEIVNELKISSNQNIWAGFEYHFLNIHESFYKNLDEKHPGLTNYDKKLAAMLKLKLSTKEISDILNVTPRTIENSRTRLRKKMNLTNSKEDLANYLNEF